MVEKSIRADEGIDAFFLSLLYLQYRAGVYVLLRITPTLPLLQISPGRLCLGPDSVCNSKCCPEGYREVHQQGSGPAPSTMEQASSKMGQGLSLPHISTELYKPSFHTLGARKGPLQYLDTAFH